MYSTVKPIAKKATIEPNMKTANSKPLRFWTNCTNGQLDMIANPMHRLRRGLRGHPIVPTRDSLPMSKFGHGLAQRARQAKVGLIFARFGAMFDCAAQQ
jgi:hypothetical protein